MGQQSKKDYAQQARERRAQIEKEKREKERRQNRIIWGIVGGILAVILIVVGIILLTMPKKTTTEPENTPATRVAPKMEEIDFSPIEGNLSETYAPTEEETDLVRMTISYTTKEGEAKQGDVYMRLYPDVAPTTVANFKSLVGRGFYNGLTFHRVYPGFMIQGGSSSVDTASIKGEFTSNGFENNLKHVRGVVSMARADDPDSASSSFFIMLVDYPSLNENYASFGYVVSGMETVDAIAEIELSYNAGGIDSVATSPVHPVTIQSAVFVKEN